MDSESANSGSKTPSASILLSDCRLFRNEFLAIYLGADGVCAFCALSGCQLAAWA